MDLFGFQILRKSKEEEKREKRASFAPPISDDGALIVSEGTFYGTYFDLEGTAKSDVELITKYREMAMQPDVDLAINHIVDEAIATDADDVVTINLDGFEPTSPFFQDDIKEKIINEFEKVCELLDFNNQAYEVFRRWYVDGRIYYHVIIDKDDIMGGIKEVRYIDPRKLRKIKEVEKVPAENGVVLTRVKNEYWLYSDLGFTQQSSQWKSYGSQDTNITGLKIAKDAIVSSTSGLTDPTGNVVLSYLNKAIKPLNSLKALEDSLVIYYFVRAPERRIFYIDVGTLPKPKAEQYLKDMMTRHKNRLTYDASSGEIRDDRKFMTMFEDYWLPRREGSKGTEIGNLTGGTQLNDMTLAVEKFKQDLYKALGIPPSRLQPESSGFGLARASEISRDEIMFSKFVDRLRRRFSMMLFDLLTKQLIMKNVIAKEDIPELYQGAWFEYATDNHFTEQKEQIILSQRLEMAKDIQNFVGKYYSHEFVRKKILRQTDDEIKTMDEQIEMESMDPRWQVPIMVGDPTFGSDMGGIPGQPPMPGQAGPGDPRDPGFDQQQPQPDPNQQFAGKPKPFLVNQNEPPINRNDTKTPRARRK